MKNSKDYSKKVLKLYRALKKKHAAVQKTVHEDPVNALVYAIACEHMEEKQAAAAFKRFRDYFVDLNDLRVSRTDDIVEMFGSNTPVMHETAARLTSALRHVFNQHHQVSLETLKRIGKRPARSELEKIEGTGRFVVDYCMLTALDGHAIPLTTAMVQYLRDNELVHPDADEQEIAGFLTKQISAKNGYEFYALLRQASETQVKRKKKTKKATKTKKITKTKTKQKTTTKVKTKRTKKKAKK